MPFDFKKEFKEFYAPKTTPELIKVPPMHFCAVRGKGNPNAPQGEYKTSVELVYALSYALKMSYKSDYKIAGFYEYVVPPLEGFWWLESGGVDYAKKDYFCFISLIRLPEFISPKDFEWAKKQVAKKKALPFEKAEFLRYDEGLCVQCLHLGSYDAEPESLAQMHDFARAKGYTIDISHTRFHHEIYLSDPRKCEISKLKTILRLPIK